MDGLQVARCSTSGIARINVGGSTVWNLHARKHLLHTNARVKLPFPGVTIQGVHHKAVHLYMFSYVLDLLFLRIP